MTTSRTTPRTWRKSSRSNSGPDQNCVEVGSWRKSTHSQSSTGHCIEAGTCPHQGIAIRDSKLPTTGSYPTLSVTHTDWTALLTTITA